MWVKEYEKYKEFPIEKELKDLPADVLTDITHTLIRRIWKGENCDHLKELISQLRINFFTQTDKKGNFCLKISLIK
jgi:hypothetical protein